MLFLRVWVEQYPGDFSSPATKAQLESFLSQHRCDSATADELLKTVSSLKEGEPQSPCEKKREEEPSKEEFSAYSLLPSKFAMGLTALESVSSKALVSHLSNHDLMLLLVNLRKCFVQSSLTSV